MTSMPAAGPWRHHWFPNGVAGPFAAKCGLDLLLKAKMTEKTFRDSITTEFDPGWGKADESIHGYIHFKNPGFDYNTKFLNLVNKSKDCCELMLGMNALITSDLVSADLYYFQESLKHPNNTYPDVTPFLPFPPMVTYEKPGHSTDGLLATVTAAVCCTQPQQQQQPHPLPLPLHNPLPSPHPVPFVPLPSPGCPLPAPNPASNPGPANEPWEWPRPRPAIPIRLWYMPLIPDFFLPPTQENPWDPLTA